MFGRDTLQGTNTSHLGERKIVDSKVPLHGDMLVPRRVFHPSFCEILVVQTSGTFWISNQKKGVRFSVSASFTVGQLDL